MLAVVALGVLGIGNSIVDVNALTIMQRAVPDAVLGRALGALDGLLLGALGLGALLAPVLIAAIGAEASLVAVGLVLPALALLTRPKLRMLDRTTAAPEATALLRRVPMLAALPEPVVERLAREAVDASFQAGTPIVREGEAGDRFYVVSVGDGGDPRAHVRARQRVRRDRAPPRRPAHGDRDGRHGRRARRARARPLRRRGDGPCAGAAAADTVVAARLGALSAGNAPV